MLYDFVTDILRFEEKAVASYVFTRLPSFEHGHHVLGLLEIYQRY